MKKTLIALAVLGASAGVAYAQSNVTIYGVVDTGFVKESGSDTRMGGNVDSRIGFRGTEDLGSGMKATFELERRFNLNDGTQASSPSMFDESDIDLDGTGRYSIANRSNWNYADMAQGRGNVDWIGAANVGLKGDTWGAVRLGRVNNLSIETFRMLDPFNQYGIGASLAKGDLLYSQQLSNTIRYDSPSWNGFGFGATYSLGNNTKGQNNLYNEIGNDGFAVNLKYDNGPILLLANFDRMVDSNDSQSWNIGGAYTYQGFKVSVGYQDARIKALKNEVSTIKQKELLVGLQYKTGPHTIGASYNYGKFEYKGWNADGSANKYALGYTYDLSKRTSVYANVAYTDSDEGLGIVYNTNGVDKDSVTGVQVGITHRF